MKRVILAIFMTVSVTSAADLSEAEKLKRIEEEVAKRREAREKAVEGRGVVYQPVSIPDSWATGRREITIKDASLSLCGQTFAMLVQKEVMISRRVADRKISISLDSASREEAAAAFERAVEAEGVAVVRVGADILVLVARADVADEKNG